MNSRLLQHNTEVETSNGKESAENNPVPVSGNLPVRTALGRYTIKMSNGTYEVGGKLAMGLLFVAAMIGSTVGATIVSVGRAFSEPHAAATSHTELHEALLKAMRLELKELELNIRRDMPTEPTKARIRKIERYIQTKDPEWVPANENWSP